MWSKRVRGAQTKRKLVELKTELILKNVKKCVLFYLYTAHAAPNLALFSSFCCFSLLRTTYLCYAPMLHNGWWCRLVEQARKYAARAITLALAICLIRKTTSNWCNCMWTQSKCNRIRQKPAAAAKQSSYYIHAEFGMRKRNIHNIDIIKR